MHYKNINLELLAHDSVRITTDKNVYIYIDPFKLPQNEALPKADYLFITHTHHDHCSLEDIQKIISPTTVVITIPDAQSKLLRFKFKEMLLLDPGKSATLQNDKHSIEVRAVAAYNSNKSFHPKENMWVGYVINIDGTTVYHSGDTDLISEMKELGAIDVAFIPVSGTYVMTAQEAALAVGFIKPKIAIPMHYGTIVGSLADAQEFEKLVKNSVPATDICILFH